MYRNSFKDSIEDLEMLIGFFKEIMEPARTDNLEKEIRKTGELERVWVNMRDCVEDIRKNLERRKEIELEDLEYEKKLELKKRENK